MNCISYPALPIPNPFRFLFFDQTLRSKVLWCQMLSTVLLIEYWPCPKEMQRKWGHYLMDSWWRIDRYSWIVGAASKSLTVEVPQRINPLQDKLGKSRGMTAKKEIGNAEYRPTSPGSAPTPKKKCLRLASISPNKLNHHSSFINYIIYKSFEDPNFGTLWIFPTQMKQIENHFFFAHPDVSHMATWSNRKWLCTWKLLSSLAQVFPWSENTHEEQIEIQGGWSGANFRTT